MTINDLRNEIKLRLTGGVLEIELSDENIDAVINTALRELQRYICSTRIITIPYKRCIDLASPEDTNNQRLKVSSVSRIYRSEGYIGESNNGTTAIDPLYASQWQLLSGVGNLQGFSDYALNYASWNTLLQIRNTMSTDLAFRFDKASQKLYVNVSSNRPKTITVEYVPKYDNVEEITSDYWTDILVRLAVALTKVTLGRIRSRYTQSNALWTQDGQMLLDEGNSELTAIREHLEKNTQLVYPID